MNLNPKNPLKDWQSSEFAGKDKEVAKAMQNKKFREEIKMNQLRNFFGEVKKLQQTNKSDLKNGIAKLEMNLAYDTGRGVISENFYKEIIKCTNNIHDEEDLKRFVEFLTALIAYHKFHSTAKGGNNND